MAKLTTEELMARYPTTQATPSTATSSSGGITPAKKRLTTEELQTKYSTTTNTTRQPEVTDESVITGVAKGIGKAGLGLVQGAGQVGRGIQRGLSKGIGAVTGIENFGMGENSPFDEDTQAGKKLTELTTATTGPQKVGKFVGDVASFALPGGAVTKASKGLPLAGRMAAEGVTGGTVAAVQQGGIDKEARDAAILSAIFPGAGAVASGIKKKIGGESASRVINSLIKPLKKDMAYGKNPGRAVANEGIIASSLDELEQKIGTKLTERIDELNNVLIKSNERFNFSKVLDPLEEALDKAVKQNNKAALNRLNDVRQALTQNLKREVDEKTGEMVIRSQGAKNLSDLSAKEATDFLREIGELTSFTGNPTDDKLVNSALKGLYGKVKGSLDNKVLSRQQLSERIGDLISAKTATKYRSEIAERANLLGFSPKVLGSVGVAASVFSGNPIPGILGLGAVGLEKALATPAAKTRLASWLAGASSEEKKQLFQKAPWAKAIMLRSLLGDE